MRIFASIMVFCLILCPAADAPAEGKNAGQAPPPLVGTSQVEMKNADRPEKFVGHVEEVSSVDLQARVEGYIEKVNFEEGAFVREGQLLYRIEQQAYKAGVASAKAEKAQAEADLYKAETRLKRLQSARSESIPQTDLDDAKAARDLAVARLQEAGANLELAEIDLSYTTVEAPIKGRIGKSFYKKGDLVRPSSDPLAGIVRMDPIRVVFSVSENRADMIQKALADADSPSDKRVLTIRLRLADDALYPEKGTIAFVDNRMDSDTGTIAVRAEFDNPNERLVPGQYVKVLFSSAKPDMQPAVPQVAVQRDRDGAFVFVLDTENRVQKRKIVTGKTAGEYFIVSSGIEKGETVIVRGLQKVSPKMTVKVENKDKKDR
ncbi:MAG: efflux RND transporter periplasmic adaptor subunit [Desulfarculaceae bacterium]|nr:efflux RND transporter periplasmic adaptor subunit [Desulfarculaceae bacterium]